MGLWGAYHKDSKYLCSSFAVKAGGGLHSKGAYFRVSTVYTVEPPNNGYIGSRDFVRCREVVRFRRF